MKNLSSTEAELKKSNSYKKMVYITTCAATYQ